MAQRWYVFVLALQAALVCCKDKPKKAKAQKVEYWQNCAARGLCDKRYAVRDQAVHEAPAGTPKGHFKPVGHPDFLDSWDGEIDVFTEVPSPEKFWKEYGNPRKPFIIKGAAFNSPAINWTDQYIMDKFGDEVAKTEWRNEDRLTDYCGQKIKGQQIFCPKDTVPYVESRMNIRNFIQKSTADPDWAKYIISQSPDEMGKEWNVPAFFNCGRRHKGDEVEGKPWMPTMYENNFWYVRVKPGMQATSTIHYDMNHQIMCMVAGTKEWIMWDLRKDKENIPMWNENFRTPDKGGPQGSDDSPIDGERVDLARWPDFAKARWRNTTIEKGDCLFTPANVLHYVRTYSDDPDDPRGLALMTMYGHEDGQYDPENCKDPPPYVPLSDFDVMWGDFPGSMDSPRCMNHIKMGYDNWKNVLSELAQKKLNEKGFMKFFKGWSKEARYPVNLIEAAWKKFQDEKIKGTWAQKCFRSAAVKNLVKDIACGLSGNKGPQRKLKDGESWDARNEYVLGGGASDKRGYVDEKHEDL